MNKDKDYIVNNEVAIKPYFYFRNGLLHCRYLVDRVIALSNKEKKDIKDRFKDQFKDSKEKQAFLLTCWKSLELERTVIQDGLREVELRYIPRFKEK